MQIVVCVCLEWRKSYGYESQPRHPDRGLKFSSWLPGNVFTELPTGDGAEADHWSPLLHIPAGEKLPHIMNRVQGRLQVECCGWGDPTPRTLVQLKRALIHLRKPWYSPGLPHRALFPKVSGSSSFLPSCPNCAAPALARCKVTVHIFFWISEKRHLYHFTACSVKDIFSFFYRFSPLTPIPRCPCWPDSSSIPSPILHIMSSRDAFIQKEMGPCYYVCCSVICCPKEHIPLAPPGHQLGPHRSAQHSRGETGYHSNSVLHFVGTSVAISPALLWTSYISYYPDHSHPRKSLCVLISKMGCSVRNHRDDVINAEAAVNTQLTIWPDILMALTIPHPKFNILMPRTFF